VGVANQRDQYSIGDGDLAPSQGVGLGVALLPVGDQRDVACAQRRDLVQLSAVVGRVVAARRIQAQ